MKEENLIVYDANFSINQYRGMGKYINSYVKVLRENFNCNILGLLSGANPENEENYKSFGFGNYILWEQISLLKIKGIAPKIRIYPYNTAPIFQKITDLDVLFLHDLIFLKKLHSKSFKQKIGKLYRLLVVPIIAKKFKYIITVSEYSKKEIETRLKIAPSKISVIPNSIVFDINSVKKNKALHERENVIFHIGGEPEHKNSKSLLYAFAQLPDDLKNNYTLKIIGIRNTNVLKEYKLISEQLGIKKQVLFLGYQSDKQVEELFNEAKMFVFPSLVEGFGIPIIEAMKFGCPVICTNLSCLPEIAGNAGHFYDPFAEMSLTDKMIDVLHNNALVEEKIMLGYKQAMKYSYESFKTYVIEWFSKFCISENINLISDI